MNKRKFSAELTQDISQPASKAMLYATGMKENDFDKYQVGIASCGYEGNPCNMHLNTFAKNIKQSVEESKLKGFIFNTIGVSDGISMGTEGMNYSMQSREIIADSIETMMNAFFYDGNISIVGCDKNMPGSIMAMARVNRPSIMLYGGTILPGCHKGKKIDIVSSFESYGEFIAGDINEKELNEVLKKACPGPGACGGMYTANTMASAIETLGMSLPYSSSSPAESQQKIQECDVIGKFILNILEKDIKPSDIMTKKAFENAITIVMILGGSTNAVIHLIAMAKTIGIKLTLDDFQKISNKTPFLADLKPSGKHLMNDLHEVGGIPAVLKFLFKEGFLHKNCLTVTGKSLEENIKNAPELCKGQKIIMPLSSPIKKTGHINILYGNLAPLGSVAKITGKEGTHFSGKAKVFNTENDCIKALENNKINKGEVVIIRYVGPRGAPGIPEMLKVTSVIMGVGLGKDIALITDGRFSGGTHGFVIGHVTPEAQNGGLIALVKNGDTITIDVESNFMNLDVSNKEIKKRKLKWKEPPLKAKSGALYKYAKLVTSASEGCVTDE